ncbi:MAG TPA: hypothetical protein VGU73_05545, partial [Acidimicrobiia bacterium]|nr:hypothetical protein [Acidimicrobiia bacterium]
MTDSDARPAAHDGEGPPPLRTTARSPVVHWLIDAAAVFLALIIVGLFLGAPWWGVALLSLLVGALVARYTWRADVRAMAARREGRT